MARLVWDSVESRILESGLDRGVLFPSGQPGVAWNGLISVSDFYVGGEQNSYYYDGIKYLDRVDLRVFEGTLTAFSTPIEFLPCMGMQSLIPGFIVTRQPRTKFDLAYRTKINGDDSYKIHFVYNALANPSNRAAATIQDNVSPEVRSWKLECVPIVGTGFKPTAHFAIRSSDLDPSALQELEDQLYGTVDTDPTMPDISDVISLIEG